MPATGVRVRLDLGSPVVLDLRRAVGLRVRWCKDLGWWVPILWLGLFKLSRDLGG